MELQVQETVGTRQGRVLVVDDEENLRKLVSRALRKCGYEVVEAADGERAIAAMNHGDNPLLVDTILCDIRMPNIDGVDAITYFRSQYPSVPVVVLTGYPDIELAVSLMKMGVANHLMKPFSTTDLVEVIRSTVKDHVLFKDQFVA